MYAVEVFFPVFQLYLLVLILYSAFNFKKVANQSFMLTLLSIYSTFRVLDQSVMVKKLC